MATTQTMLLITTASAAVVYAQMGECTPH